MLSTKELKPVTAEIINIDVENEFVKSFYLSRIESKVIINNIIPGNFLMLWIPQTKDSETDSENILDNIPMSISDCYNDIIKITVRKSGNSTEELHKYSIGDKIGIMGPFGRGFSLEGDKILLVAGGIGIAPLSYLAKIANKSGKKIYLVFGAKNKNELLLIKEMERICDKIFITTDDGSEGIKGFAPDIVEQICNQYNIDYIYTCGPEIMMKKILDISLKIDIPGQFSLERYMHCGIGVCGFCSVNNFYVCRDGPIFYTNELKKITEFGSSSRTPDGVSKKFFNFN